MELQTSLGHTITVEHAAWEDGKPRIALRTFDSLNDLTWILKLHEATQLAMFLEAPS